MKITGFIGFYGNNVERYWHTICERLFNCIDNAMIYRNESSCVTYSQELALSPHPTSELKLQIGIESTKHSAMVSTVTINEMLYLRRDYWGIRNIYYAMMSDGILFASDLKLILFSREYTPLEYDEKSLEECSSLGYIYREDATLFRGIKKVRKNETLCRSKEKDAFFLKNHKALKYTFRNFDDAYGVLLSTLEKVVRDSMVNLKGNKLFMLSGGIDSTVLSVFASQCHAIHTATFLSDDNKEDAFYASSVAKLISSKHQEIVFPKDAIHYIPEYLHSVEFLEMDGIFSPLGGLANYLFVKEMSCPQGTILFSGDGADELLAGYYWQFTHPYGFVDKLKQLTKRHRLYDEISCLFPLPEEKEQYRSIIQKFLLGTALTNYHLNCIEHIARRFKVHSVPIYMDKRLTDIMCSIPISWLCNDWETKRPLKKILVQYLASHDLGSLVSRKKMAMPSSVPNNFMKRLHKLSLVYKRCNHPYAHLLGFSPMNIMMFDILHKYFTLSPIDVPEVAEWEQDMERMRRSHEPIVYW